MPPLRGIPRDARLVPRAHEGETTHGRRRSRPRGRRPPARRRRRACGAGPLSPSLGLVARDAWDPEDLPDLTGRRFLVTGSNAGIGFFSSLQLAAAGALNVRVELGDAAQGWPTHAPYDVIVVSGALPVLPQELVAQLRPGGRLVAFIGEAPVMNCVLVKLNADGTQSQETLFETVVPTLRNARGGQRFVF